MEILRAQAYRMQIIKLLQSSKLPVADLPMNMEHFYVAVNDDGKLAGVIGLEVYGSNGLLRSLAVEQRDQGKGIAGILVDRIEKVANILQLKYLYLLTETAAEYFEKKGYDHVGRADVTLPIQQSSQFKETCPASAVTLIKPITPR